MSVGGGTQKVKSSTSVPWYQQKTGEYLYNQGLKESQTPYEAYSGNRIAGFSPEQEAAYQGVVRNQNDWRPLLDRATAETNAATANWVSPGVSQQYMDPYQQGVTDIAKREAERAYGIQSKLAQGRAAQAGAWGGSQAGVAQAAGQRDYLQQLNDIQTKGLESAYQSGLGAFQADRSNALNVANQYAGLGNQLQNQGYTDTSALESAGRARQAQNQMGLDQQYQDFLEKRGWNKNQINWFASLMNQAASPTSTTQSTTQPGGSIAGQAIGGAETLGSLALIAKMMMAPAASDRRLKQDISKLGIDETGLPVYQFRYKDNPDYEFIGYMADDVRKLYPNAVMRIGEYDAVDYGAL